MTRYSRFALALASISGFAALTGCGLGTSAGPATLAMSAINGKVMGGHQPVSGATVTVYAAGKTGYGSTPTTIASGTSDANGNFGLATTTPCTSGDQLYIVANGGNPGLTPGTNNAAATLVAALGTCPGITSSILVNEVTTVAAAYALSGFATFDGSSSAVATSNTNNLGLTHAFANAATLANTSTGQPNSKSSNGNGTIPVSLINTVANALAQCVNSTGAGSNGCNAVLVAAPAGSATTPVTPTNTWQAALAVAKYPVNNASAIYTSAITAPVFYTPYLAAAPNDFSLGIAYTAGLQADGATAATAPIGIAADAQGNIWVSGMVGAPLVELDYSGKPLTAAGGAGDGTFQALTTVGSVALDTMTNPNVWVASTSGSIFQFTEAGAAEQAGYLVPASITVGGAGTNVQTAAYNIAIDAGNNVWYGTNTAAALGTACSSTGTSPTQSPTNTFGELTRTGTNYAPRTTYNFSPLLTSSIPATGSCGSNYLAIAPGSNPGTATGGIWTSTPPRAAADFYSFSDTFATKYTASAYVAAQSIVFDSGNTGAWIVGSGAGTNNGRVTKFAPPAPTDTNPFGTAAATTNAIPETNKTSLFAGAMDGQNFFFISTAPQGTATTPVSIATFNAGLTTGNAGTFVGPTSAAQLFTPVDSTGASLLTATSVVKNVAIDSTGSLWIANNTAGTTVPVIQILGAAAPTPVIAAGYGVRP